MRIIQENNQEPSNVYTLPPVVPREERGGSPRHRGRWILLVVLLVAALGGIGYYYRVPILNYLRGSSVIGEAVAMENDMASQGKFVSIGEERFFYCTRDGVRFFDGVGNQVWNQTFTMNSPAMVQAGELVAVAELQGRSAYVFSETGQKYAVQASGPILQLCLTKEGAMALLEQNGDHFKIQVYSHAGQLLMERFEEDEGIYPLAVSLSADGRVLAVSYLDTTGVQIKTRVLLFYTAMADSANTETGDYYAGVEEDGVIAPVLYTMENGVFAAVTNGTVFGVSPEGSKAWSIPLGNEVTAVSSGGSYLAIALGEEDPQKESLPEGTVLIFSDDVQQMASFDAGGAISYLKANQFGLVVGSGRSFWGVRPQNGQVLWQYQATEDVQDILLIQTRKGLYVTGQQAVLKVFEKQ